MCGVGSGAWRWARGACPTDGPTAAVRPSPVWPCARAEGTRSRRQHRAAARPGMRDMCGVKPAAWAESETRGDSAVSSGRAVEFGSNSARLGLVNMGAIWRRQTWPTALRGPSPFSPPSPRNLPRHHYDGPPLAPGRGIGRAPPVCPGAARPGFDIGHHCESPCLEATISRPVFLHCPPPPPPPRRRRCQAPPPPPGVHTHPPTAPHNCAGQCDQRRLQHGRGSCGGCCGDGRQRRLGGGKHRGRHGDQRRFDCHRRREERVSVDGM